MDWTSQWQVYNSLEKARVLSGIFQMGFSSMTSTSTINKTPSCPAQKDGAPYWPAFLRWIMCASMETTRPTTEIRGKKMWPDTLAAVLVSTGPTKFDGTAWPLTTLPLLPGAPTSSSRPTSPWHASDVWAGLDCSFFDRFFWKHGSWMKLGTHHSLYLLKHAASGWSANDHHQKREIMDTVKPQGRASKWSFTLKGFGMPGVRGTWHPKPTARKVVVAPATTRPGPHLLHRDPFTATQEDHANIALHDGLHGRQGAPESESVWSWSQILGLETARNEISPPESPQEFLPKKIWLHPDPGSASRSEARKIPMILKPGMDWAAGEGFSCPALSKVQGTLQNWWIFFECSSSNSACLGLYMDQIMYGSPLVDCPLAVRVACFLGPLVTWAGAPSWFWSIADQTRLDCRVLNGSALP